MAVVLAVVSVALVVGADVSCCALLDLVRTENLSRSLSARLNLFLDPSAAEADEAAGSVGCCWPDSLASCLRMAIRSWTGAWRVARIRWTREWWTTASAGTAGVGSASVGEEGSPALKLLRTGRRSTRLRNIRVSVKQPVGYLLTTRGMFRRHSAARGQYMLGDIDGYRVIP